MQNWASTELERFYSPIDCLFGQKNMDRLALGIVCLDGLFKLKFALKCLKKRVRAIEHASDSTGLTFRPQLAPCSPS
jgi:hypothetical protein